MPKKKPSWKITRQISTGKLLFNYWDKKDIPDSDKEELEPHSFKDDLTYIGYYHAASGGAVRWESKGYKGSHLTSSIDFLNNIFRENIDTKLELINVKPLIIRGDFLFVKRGSEIRIIENE
jgi:hypothetical protein